MAIVLVEGMPRCGISKIAAGLAADLNLPLIEIDAAAASSVPALISTLTANGTSMVLAGHLHLAVAAHREGFSPEAWTALDDHLARHRTWLLLLVDTPHAIERRLQPLSEHPYRSLTREQLGTILARFNEALRVSNVPSRGSFRLPQLIDPTTGERSEQYRGLAQAIKSRLERS